MSSLVLGISAFYHDSAAAIISNGEICAAAQEERFSRIKHDDSFPEKAVSFCLESVGSSLSSLDAIIYYEKPLLTFERLLETSLAVAPRGSRAFIKAMRTWSTDKIFLKRNIQDKLCLMYACRRDSLPPILFSEHHLSHAGAAFYPSRFSEAVILCMDGVGEWATTSAWMGKDNRIESLWEISFPHSLGLLYSAFTSYCGFKVNSGEYKLMGLAPYGMPVFADLIRSELIDIKPDGSFRLNLGYFKYHRGLRMTSRLFHQLFKEPPRKQEEPLSQFHMDVAASIQVVTEEIILSMADSLHAKTNVSNICLSGGVALNCVANGRLQREGKFKNIWIQPASGDAGSAVGAALVAWYQHFKNPRQPQKPDSMGGTYLGPYFYNVEIQKTLSRLGAQFQELEDSELFERVAELLEKGNVVGWFNGRMEFGPRALGNRSIIADPRNPRMQNVMNLKIKYRESFRPFAPTVLEEESMNVFDLKGSSPYMLLVAPVKEKLRVPVAPGQDQLVGIEKLNVSRSTLPAITHVDYSSRVQTVNSVTNPRYYSLIKAFQRRTGCPVLVNTSFNVRGEPIVCTPTDAYRCFMRTDMDALVLENQLLLKSEQPEPPDDQRWLQEFELD